MPEINAGESRMSAGATDARPGLLKTWWIASRPFSLPASAMAVAFGTAGAAAMTGAPLRWFFFLLALAGMMVLHAAANVLNDVYDYRKGIDKEVLPVSGAVVRRYLSESEALRGAAVLFFVGAAVGIFLCWQTSWLILPIGAVGAFLGVFYSATRLALKYRALGDFCVFFSFGVLGSLGAWIVQTGEFSWIPVLWAVPQSLLVIGILHANNWRDIAGDTAGGFPTIASLLGDRGS